MRILWADEPGTADFSRFDLRLVEDSIRGESECRPIPCTRPFGLKILSLTRLCSCDVCCMAGEMAYVDFLCKVHSNIQKKS